MTSHDPEDRSPEWFKRDIVRATTEFEHDAVSHVQRVLGVPNVNGEMDTQTISHIKGFQMLFGLRVTGYLDEQTAIQVDRIRHYRSV